MCTCLCVCELALELTGSVREIDDEDRVLDLQGLVQQQPLVVAHPLFASHGGRQSLQEPKPAVAALTSVDCPCPLRRSSGPSVSSQCHVSV